MMKLKSLFIAVGVLGCMSLSVNGQVKTPQPSPTAEIEQKIGLTEIEITYSRPGIKGRKIYGELVPFGEVWRTGANAATKIEVKDPIKVAGKDLLPGKYSILTIPDAGEWTIIFNSDPKTSVSNYDQAKDVFRFKVKPKAYAERTESFTIDFANFKDNGADVRLIWENTIVSFPIEVETAKMVQETIDKTLAGPSSRDYYQSARYYAENDMDINKAVEWINKAVELDGEDQKFWVTHWQAKILAKSGDKKGAIKAAEKSLELSKAANYMSYIENNEKLLKELNEK